MIDNATAESLDRYQTNNTYCFDNMFVHVKPLLLESDYVFANLETPISYDNTDLTRLQWLFCSPREFAEAVKNMGVDFVSTSNNHCLDRGINGLKATLRVLDEVGLKHTGTYCSSHNRKNCVVEVNGFKIGCLAYTYGTNAVSNHNYLGYKNRKMVDLIQEQEGYIDRIDPINRALNKFCLSSLQKLRDFSKQVIFPENAGKKWFERRTFDLYRKHLIKQDIKRAKKAADYCVLMLHIGGQYNKEPNEYTKKTIKWLLKKKIDIIISNHEHVVHGHEYFAATKQFATYSIGNFIGGAGTIRPPYDKKSEYSIAIHFYFEGKAMSKISFTVLKTVLDSLGRLTVFPAHELINKNSELKDEIIEIANVFSNKKYSEVEKEFLMYE